MALWKEKPGNPLDDLLRFAAAQDKVPVCPPAPGAKTLNLGCQCIIVSVAKVTLRPCFSWHFDGFPRAMHLFTTR
jgi:hypothetical protein